MGPDKRRYSIMLIPLKNELYSNNLSRYLLKSPISVDPRRPNGTDKTSLSGMWSGFFFLISPPQCTLGRISPDNVANHAPGFEYAVIYPARDLDSTCIRPWYPRAPRPSPVTPLHRALSRCARSARTGIPLWLLIWSVGHKGLSRCDLPSRSEISLYCTRDVRHVGLAPLNVDTRCPVTIFLRYTNQVIGKRYIKCSLVSCHTWQQNQINFVNSKLELQLPPVL